jgi:hypothetical protein
MERRSQHRFPSVSLYELGVKSMRILVCAWLRSFGVRSLRVCVCVCVPHAPV